jgi:hypothetical protein
MKVKLTVEGKELTATLVDGPTSRDFLALLPLTLTMNAASSTRRRAAASASAA